MPVSSEPLYLEPPSGGFADLVTSDSAGWTSMRLRLTESIANQDEFESAPKGDVSIEMPIEPVKHMQVLASGQWKSFEAYRGLVAFTPPAQTWRLRYNSGQDNNAAKYLHLYIPASTLIEVTEHLLPRAASGKHLDAAIFEDKLVMHFALSVLQSLRDGASNFYAETSAQWLSAHLMSRRYQIAGWFEKISKARVTDLRLLRVLEYIEGNIGTDLSLEVLAREAGISQLQFATAFQKQMGMSPNKHVHILRMQNASRMLCESNRSGTEVALLCGFKTASHFGVAFHKHFGRRPKEYRSEQMWGKLGLKNSVAPRSMERYTYAEAKTSRSGA